MTQNDPRNDATGTNPGYAAGSTGGYLWQVPGKPVAVRLNIQASRLDRQVADAVRSITAVGSELGGLLLGKVAPGNPMLVTVEDYELIPCDYSRGPLYKPSEADIRRFDQAISKRESEGKGLEVVGFFRSHTRKGLALDADDLTFCTRRFNKPHHIVLLIRPSIGQASRAGIFVWERGTIRGEASDLEFSFSGEGLVKGATVNQTPLANRPPTAAPIPATVVTPAKISEPVQETPKRADIVPIVLRREATQVPPLKAAPPQPTSPAPVTGPSAAVPPSPKKPNRSGLEARVGRCSVKVQLRADTRRPDASKPAQNPPGRTV